MDYAIVNSIDVLPTNATKVGVVSSLQMLQLLNIQRPVLAVQTEQGYEIYTIDGPSTSSATLEKVAETVEKVPPVVEDVSQMTDEGLLDDQAKEIGQKIMSSLEPETPKAETKGRWVKPTPTEIRKGRRVRCIVGSNAGREATIVNVVREGKPDAETVVYETQEQPITSYVDPNTGEQVSNSQQANRIMGQMVMMPLHSRPDNVTIEWDQPREDSTNVSEIVNGVRLNTKQVTAPLTHSNLTKKKICTDFMIWIED